MTLAVLWMDPMSVERMMMAGLNVICHLLGLMGLNGEIPSNGASLPSIRKSCSRLIDHHSALMHASREDGK